MNQVREDSESWRARKRAGDAGEVTVAMYAHLVGATVTPSPVGTVGWDMALDRLKLEVKTDSRALLSGRAAIEIARDDKPSGLYRTVARTWVFVIGIDLYLVSVSTLRAMVEGGSYRIVPAGDSKRTKCVLVPLDDLAAAGVRFRFGGAR